MGCVLGSVRVLGKTPTPSSNRDFSAGGHAFINT